MSDSEQQTPEHRGQPRNTVQEKIDVIDLLSGETIGNLINISEGGFMLITDQELPLNSLFQLRLVLPEGLTEASNIEVGAESLWSNASTTSDYLWYGFHIIDISTDNAKVIDQLSQSWRC